MSELTKFPRIKRKEGKEKRDGEQGKENRAVLYFVKNSKGVEVQYERDGRAALQCSGQSGPQGPRGQARAPHTSSLLMPATEKQGGDSTSSITSGGSSLQLRARGGYFLLP